MQEIDNEKREIRRLRIKKQKRRRLITLAVITVIAIVLIVLIVKLISWIFTPKYVESANTGPLPPAEDTPIVITIPPKYYDYGMPVPEADAVGDGYFDSVLMIGDARVTGFPIFGYLPNLDCLASESISVDAVKDYSFEIKGSTRTLSEQLASKRYDSIYIQVGLNELGWPNASAFRDSYSELVDMILELSPHSSIYMQGVIPVTAGKSGNPSYITNERVSEYNRLIKQIAESKKVYYLDVTEGLSGGTGALISGYAASNGLSLSKEGYDKWIDYIKTHVVDESQYA